MSKRRIVIVAEHFYPGFKAGGPIQSLIHLIDLCRIDYEFYVITSAFDLNDSIPYDSIQMDKWSVIGLPGHSHFQKVWYSSTRRISFSKMSIAINGVRPDVIFINGLYTRWFLFPLLLRRLKKIGEPRIVISPRGMLQKGALVSGKIKKRLYLRLVKVLGVLRDVEWHATTDDEVKDIRREIDMHARVVVAPNVPRTPMETIHLPEKKPGVLKIVYVSIITSKKNLHLLINILGEVQGHISLDIYGPVKENGYWERCKAEIAKLRSNVKATYYGAIMPEKVQSVIGENNAFVSLTKGENFGHALYESLSSGRPLITSRYTPWTDLESKKAGWNLVIEDKVQMVDALNRITEMDHEQFHAYCKGAWELARDYYFNSDFLSHYKKLFR